MLYTSANPSASRRPQIVKRQPEGDRARGRDQAFQPTLSSSAKLATPRGAVRHRLDRLARLDGGLRRSSTSCSTVARSASSGFGNFSYFDSPKYNRLLDEASRLTGTERYRAYGELDVELSRDAAPAIPFAGLNAWTFVSRRDRLRRHEPEPRPDRGLPQVTRALAATLFAALVLIPAAGTHGIKEGGTFRVGMGGGISSIDPVTTAPVILTSVTCAGLMRLDGTPRRARDRRRLPEAHERRQDVHLHDSEGRPLLDRLAGDGSRRSSTRSTAC